MYYGDSRFLRDMEETAVPLMRNPSYHFSHFNISPMIILNYFVRSTMPLISPSVHFVQF